MTSMCVPPSPTCCMYLIISQNDCFIQAQLKHTCRKNKVLFISWNKENYTITDTKNVQ